MFVKFIDDGAAAERFADAVRPDTWSPAQVQERLLKATTLEHAIALFDEAVVPLRRAA
jgi:hypothetical protein